MSQTYINNSKEFYRLFEANKLRAHTSMAEVGLEGVQEETPVQTGMLKGNNIAYGKEDAAYWENQTEYAAYVHMGTYKQAANPWIIRGVMKKSSQIIRAVINALKV